LSISERLMTESIDLNRSESESDNNTDDVTPIFAIDDSSKGYVSLRPSLVRSSIIFCGLVYICCNLMNLGVGVIYICD